MPKRKLSPGKWQRLRSLTDEQGRFFMLAIDQRDSLRNGLEEAAQTAAAAIHDDDLTRVKGAIVKTLAPYASGVLIDPVYGYPQCIEHFPSRVGLLLSHEETGYTIGGASKKERQTHLLEGWSVEKAQRLGADAVKLLLYYRPDGSEEMCQQQQETARRVGEACAQGQMPFLLELLAYPLGEGNADGLAYARKKPELVIKSAEEFSKPDYQVDILKLEFPANLKWTREYTSGAFDGQQRQAAYALSDVEAYCRQLNAASAIPWVILSAGVNIEEFLAQVDLATAAGASGFLCGRAIWKDAVPLYPDMTRMEAWLRTEGAHNFVRAKAHAERALPWHRHRAHSLLPYS